MAESATPPWSADAHARIDALLNQIIPAGPAAGLPAAGALGVGAFVAARVAEDPALARLFAETLDRVPPDAAAAETAFPAFFEALQRLAYMGYYSRPDIRARMGLSAKPVHPVGYAVPDEPEALLAELTAQVRARGQCYRDA